MALSHRISEALIPLSLENRLPPVLPRFTKHIFCPETVPSRGMHDPITNRSICKQTPSGAHYLN